MKKAMVEKAPTKTHAPTDKAAATKKAAKPSEAVKPSAAAKPAVKLPFVASQAVATEAKPSTKAKVSTATAVSDAVATNDSIRTTVDARSGTAPAAAVSSELPAHAAASGAAVAEAPRPRKSGRGASKYFVAQLPTPLPPPTSRFADRFAPPRPPTRQMNNLEVDVPKHAQKSDPKLANAWKSKSGRELTEAEVLAMPESEYMNEKQLEFFRAKLRALKDDLLSNAGETTEHLREDTSIVPDPADRATIEEEHALELRTRDRERKLLKKISQSLARLDSGDYGFCDETGEPIGLGRLIARPTATLSLEAQQRRELKQKMFGD
jgi:DnaK suppressor protein